MKTSILLPVLAIIAVTAVPVTAVAQYAAVPVPGPVCDPIGPRSAFSYGVPTADNPSWCGVAEGYGHGMAVVGPPPAPWRAAHFTPPQPTPAD